MDKKQALSFLKANQPMVATANLTQDELDTYDKVRLYFMDNPEEACVPLFLNSFGDGDAHGVYQLVEDVITQFPKATVVPHLKQALVSPHASVRYWCTQIASVFPDPSLRTQLMKLAASTDVDIRVAAVTALENIEGDDVTSFLKDLLQKETDEDLLEILEEIIEDRD